MIENPNIVIRGLTPQEAKDIEKTLSAKLKESLAQKKPNIKDWIYMRKFIAEVAEKAIFRLLRKRPLIIPVVIEM
jgi:mRNA degradation ribonuclease J1/J2